MDYAKITNFATKDTLPSGNSGKIVKGVEIDDEFNAISGAIASKANTASPAFTGTPSAPTALPGTNTTQLATTAFATAAAIAAFPSGGIIIWSGASTAIPSGWRLCDGTNSTPDLRNRFIVGAGSTYAVGATGGSTDAITVAHTHTYSGTTDGIGNHTHSFEFDMYAEEGSGVPAGGSTSMPYDGHFAGTTGAAGAHSHTYSGTTASTGSSGTNANLPPYYALCYIMKA